MVAADVDSLPLTTSCTVASPVCSRPEKSDGTRRMASTSCRRNHCSASGMLPAQRDSM